MAAAGIARELAIGLPARRRRAHPRHPLARERVAPLARVPREPRHRPARRRLRTVDSRGARSGRDRRRRSGLRRCSRVSAMTTIAILGLGEAGRRYARGLAHAGADVRGFDPAHDLGDPDVPQFADAGRRPRRGRCGPQPRDGASPRHPSPATRCRTSPRAPSTPTSTRPSPDLKQRIARARRRPRTRDGRRRGARARAARRAPHAAPRERAGARAFADARAARSGCPSRSSTATRARPRACGCCGASS